MINTQKYISNGYKVSLMALLTGFAIFGNYTNNHAALSCSNPSTLDWDIVGWPNAINLTGNIGDYTADLSENFVNIGGSTVDALVEISSDASVDDLNRSFEFYVDGNAGVLVPDVLGDPVGPGGGETGLAVIVNPANDAFTARIDLDVFIDVTLSEPVSELELTVSDIDHNDTNQDRQDSVTIVGNGVSGVVIPTLTAANTTPNFTIAGNTATAIINNINAAPVPDIDEIPAADATVIVNFDQPVTSFRISYADAIETAGNVGGLRGISMLNDFSFCPTYNVNGTVFEDADGNGNFSVGDTAISGVTVELFADDGTGNPTGTAIDSQTTDGSGNYTFNAVAQGDYVIVETDPTGLVSVTDINGDTTSPANNQIPVTVSTANISGQDFLDIPSANLSVVKDDNELTYTPGENFVYSITVSNSGPSNANGAVVADNLPTWATSVTWTCGSVTGGAVCPTAAGTGDINEVIATFPANSSLTYTISGTYSSDSSDY